LYKLNFIGSKFWKTNKKIKAVTETDYNSYVGIYNDDEDFNLSPITKKRSKHSLIIHVSDSSEDEVLSNNSKPSTSKRRRSEERFEILEQR
jgi:hypothetical protein